jgi:hypothetical protein
LLFPSHYKERLEGRSNEEKTGRTREKRKGRKDGRHYDRKEGQKRKGGLLTINAPQKKNAVKPLSTPSHRLQRGGAATRA